MLLTGCNSETPEQRRERLRQEWQAWASEQKKPALTLEAPSLTSELTVPIGASSNEGTTTTLWVDDELVRKSEGYAAAGVFLRDGTHEVRAEATWCFTPEREELRQFGSTCPTAFAQATILADTSPPLIDDLQTEACGNHFAVTGSVDDLLPTTIGIGEHRTEAIEGKFSLEVSYKDALPSELATLVAVDSLGHRSCKYFTVPAPPRYWARYNSNGDLVEINADPNFEQPKPSLLLLGFGTDEWSLIVDGKEVGGWYTPREFYIGLGIGALVLFLGAIGAFVYYITLPGRKVAHALERAIEKASPAKPALLPSPVAGLLAEFAEWHPEAAQQLEAFLEKEKGRLLLEEGVHE